ncbi:hypothetical protein DL767_001192 [Monosporascus sp. MG133]|nr:hypothetical protein DL767_001192 [Monosporascus sp. MG133]
MCNTATAGHILTYLSGLDPAPDQAGIWKSNFTGNIGGKDSETAVMAELLAVVTRACLRVENALLPHYITGNDALASCSPGPSTLTSMFVGLIADDDDDEAVLLLCQQYWSLIKSYPSSVGHRDLTGARSAVTAVTRIHDVDLRRGPLRGEGCTASASSGRSSGESSRSSTRSTTSRKTGCAGSSPTTSSPRDASRHLYETMTTKAELRAKGQAIVDADIAFIREQPNGCDFLAELLRKAGFRDTATAGDIGITAGMLRGEQGQGSISGGDKGGGSGQAGQSGQASA